MEIDKIEKSKKRGRPKKIEKNELVEEENPQDEVVKKFYLPSYSKVHVYIYYDQNDCYVYSFIKNLQNLLDKTGLGSMVVMNHKFINNILIRNCYKTDEDGLKKWTNLSPTFEKVCCVKFNKLPTYTVEQLFEYMKLGKHEDEFVVILEN